MKKAIKAEILGLLASDGSHREYISNYQEYNKEKNKYYRRNNKLCKIIEFKNTNIKLVKRLIILLKKYYKYSPKIGLDTTGVYRLPITRGDVISEIKNEIHLGNNSWDVPKSIIKGNDSVKKSFVKGFFDGDGSTDISKSGTPRIRISSTNLKGLKNISRILLDLKIKHTFNGPYYRENRKDSYEIYVIKESINKFINIIGSAHSKKQTRFKKILKMPGLPKVKPG